MIYPAIRGISISFEGLQDVTLVCFLDRPPNEDDYDNLSCIVCEIVSDVEFESVKEDCVYTTQPLPQISDSGIWVYRRQEADS